MTTLPKTTNHGERENERTSAWEALEKSFDDFAVKVFSAICSATTVQRLYL